MTKTWAPRGRTPVHRHRQKKRERISVISALSVSPRRQRLGLYYQLYLDGIGRQEVCIFLRHLLRHLRGRVVVLLDKSSTHRDGQLNRLLQEKKSRLRLEYFPTYAPELNPDEGVWCWSKRQMANSCLADIDELIAEVIRCMEQMRKSSQKLRACILQSELPSFLR